MASSPVPQPVDTSKWECGICYELLLDPVVGSCGHDFCRACLDKWRSQQRQRGREVRCPVCRGVFAEGSERLGICFRLRDMVEEFFPDKVAARRAELEKQAAADRKRTAARVEQEELVFQPGVFSAVPTDRAGRRIVRVRRRTAQQPAAVPAPGTAVSNTQAQTFSFSFPGFSLTGTSNVPISISASGFGIQHTPETHGNISAFGLGGASGFGNITGGFGISAAGTPGFASTTAAGSSSSTAIGNGLAPGTQSALTAPFGSWSPPPPLQPLPPLQGLQFTMGWYDPNVRRYNRRAGRRR
eukprot:GHUV01007883.1.p1 GENE.GHUV01007883.1~~GHUV01007883.1.p1  ORF type:complete len:299 (+),score=53.85 GHUV01007883.1:394-1290(+)